MSRNASIISIFVLNVIQWVHYKFIINTDINIIKNRYEGTEKFVIYVRNVDLIWSYYHN